MNYIAKFDWEKRLKRLKSKYKIGIIWLPEVADEFARLLIDMIDDWKCRDFITTRENWCIVRNGKFHSVVHKTTGQELHLDFYERLNFGNLPKFYKKN